MKIAIAVENKKIESNVSSAVGRAPYYLLFEDNKQVKEIKNPFAVGGGGAGFSVVQMLSNENVELIIGGKFGDNIISAIEDKNMKHISALGKTAKEALDDLLSENKEEK